MSKRDGEKKLSHEMVGIALILAGGLPAWVAKVFLASYDNLLNKEADDEPTTPPNMYAEE